MYDNSSIRIYKRNCSTCHKLGFFHCRPVDAANDFILTSPSTIEELGDYRAFAGKTGLYFCKSCGVRPFGLGGGWKQVELNVDEWAGKDGAEGKMQKVWMTEPKGEITLPHGPGGKEVTLPLHYLSVNATTLEVGEGGVDLKEWHEKGWIFYVENREGKNGPKQRFKEPHPPGMY
jgi:hypothetical protein